MGIEVHSTKKYLHLPTAHCQYFDTKEDGSPGDCASLHGYDRSVELTFSGEVDKQGWLVPFGGLKEVKDFIEYYLDHTSLFPANDPRIATIPASMVAPGGVLGTMRILPYGVSMEMTSLFLWEHINPYIDHITHGRCYLSKVQCFEHERNTAYITVDRETALSQSSKHRKTPFRVYLPKQQQWQYEEPGIVIWAHGAR